MNEQSSEEDSSDETTKKVQSKRVYTTIRFPLQSMSAQEKEKYDKYIDSSMLRMIYLLSPQLENNAKQLDKSTPQLVNNAKQLDKSTPQLVNNAKQLDKSVSHYMPSPDFKNPHQPCHGQRAHGESSHEEHHIIMSKPSQSGPQKWEETSQQSEPSEKSSSRLQDDQSREEFKASHAFGSSAIELEFSEESKEHKRLSINSKCSSIMSNQIISFDLSLSSSGNSQSNEIQIGDRIQSEPGFLSHEIALANDHVSITQVRKKTIGAVVIESEILQDNNHEADEQNGSNHSRGSSDHQSQQSEHLSSEHDVHSNSENLDQEVQNDPPLISLESLPEDTSEHLSTNESPGHFPATTASRAILSFSLCIANLISTD